MAQKILVIENQEQLRRDIVGLLTDESFIADEATTSLDGIDKLYSATPDLVICDTNPPQIDSYAVLKHIKNDTTLANLPVIVMTSKLATFDEQARKEFSNAEYLEKPFQAVDLLVAIRMCLRTLKPMVLPPLREDELLMTLLKAKLDAFIARRPNVSDPQELAQLSRQYQAVLHTMVELGYSHPFDLDDELLYASKLDYDPVSNVDFSALERPDYELQLHLLNTISHELRNPLATIQTSAYILSRLVDDQLSKRQRIQLARIAHQTERLVVFMDGLLESVREVRDKWRMVDATNDDESKT